MPARRQKRKAPAKAKEPPVEPTLRRKVSIKLRTASSESVAPPSQSAGQSTALRESDVPLPVTPSPAPVVATHPAPALIVTTKALLVCIVEFRLWLDDEDLDLTDGIKLVLP